jgi:glycosyltransferase involved in cell wall biosynthesis
VQVLIDGRALVGNRTGIGVHTAEIARRLGVDPPPLIATHAPIDDRSDLTNCRFRLDRMPLGVLWQQVVLPRIANDEWADVLWSPHTTLPLFGRTPAVVSLHDFTTLTMPFRHELSTLASFNVFIGRSLHRANKIAAVSRVVADEARRWFGVSPRQIEVIPNGVDDFFSLGDEPRGDFILFAGTIEPRKGIHDLLTAWSSLPEPRPRLVIAGDRGWRVRLPDGVEVTGYVTRERLRELYRTARLFVYPSRSEGFGIPPLEAMACGTPVVATRVGAIPEYGDGAALLVDPGDAVALRTAMLRLLRDAALREELRARGLAVARQYPWERSAERMTELLAEAAR